MIDSSLRAAQLLALPAATMAHRTSPCGGLKGTWRPRRRPRCSLRRPLSGCSKARWAARCACRRSPSFTRARSAQNTVVNNDPTPKPEKSWTGKLTAKRDFGNRRLRATLFHERTTDALYWQTHVTNIQNVNAVRTTGVELAAQADDAGLTGWNRAGA